MLEIGLGCDMKYGPGASVKLWKQILKISDEIWEAEVDKDCAEKFKKTLEDVKIVSGDQADEATLRRWVVETNANNEGFDVIIDDGGHENHQIYASFNVLFHEALAPGGLYFIEDLHVNRLVAWKDATGF